VAMSERERVFIGIGSNMGNRRGNIVAALSMLREASDVLTLVRESPLYESAPWGVLGQRPFVNTVIEVSSVLGPLTLLRRLKEIERRVGRRVGLRWGPRVIDLDILFFGRRVVDLRQLTLPHPRLYERVFVLKPMLDIAPDFIDPLCNESIRGLKARLKGDGALKRLEKF